MSALRAVLSLVFVVAGCEGGATVPTPAPSADAQQSAASSPSSPVTKQPAGDETIVVYKSPTCGCCTEWAAYLRREGFSVDEKRVSDVEKIKDDLGVPQQLRSCHTATIGGYVLEGHVPAAQIVQLLTARPEVTGLAVPGMPQGSPGMESPTPEAYSVMSFDQSGRTSTFALVSAPSTER